MLKLSLEHITTLEQMGKTPTLQNKAISTLLFTHPTLVSKHIEAACEYGSMLLLLHQVLQSILLLVELSEYDRQPLDQKKEVRINSEFRFHQFRRMKNNDNSTKWKQKYVRIHIYETGRKNTRPCKNKAVLKTKDILFLVPSSVIWIWMKGPSQVW